MTGIKKDGVSLYFALVQLNYVVQLIDLHASKDNQPASLLGLKALAMELG